MAILGAITRLAARKCLKAEATYPGRVHMVRFHELVADPLAAATEIAALLETEPAMEIHQPEKPNSSYKGDARKKRPLTGLEARLIRIISGVRKQGAAGLETFQSSRFPTLDFCLRGLSHRQTSPVRITRTSGLRDPRRAPRASYLLQKTIAYPFGWRAGPVITGVIGNQTDHCGHLAQSRG